MPKIPQFTPETKVTTEGPNTLVDASTYGIEGRTQAQGILQQGNQKSQGVLQEGRQQAQGFLQEGNQEAKLAESQSALWGTVGKSGEKLEEMGVHFAKVGQHLQHAKDVVAVQKVIGQRDLQLGELKLKNQMDPGFINITDDQGNSRPRTWQETQTFATEQSTNVVNSLRAGLSPSAQALFDAHSAKPIADTVLHMTGEAQKREIGNIVRDGQGAIDDKVQLVATGQADVSELTNTIAVLGTTGLFTPQQMRKLEKESYNKVDVTSGKLQADSNPDDFLGKIKDRGFLKNITEPQRNELANYASSIKTKNQAVLWDDLQKGMAKGVMPTQDQVNSLKGEHQLTVSHLLKSMANEDNNQVKLDIGSRIIQLKSDPTPENIAQADQLYKEVESNQNLSTATKLPLLQNIMVKKNGAQVASGQFMDTYLLGFKERLTPGQFKLFLNQFATDPTGRESLGEHPKPEDVMKAANRIAYPFVQNTVDELSKPKGKSGKGGSMEKAQKALFGGGGGGKPTVETSGFRPGRYKLPDGNVVSIRSQADYDKYQGK